MIRLVIICKYFVSSYMIYRWRILAREYKDLDVTLLGGNHYSTNAFGKTIVEKCEPVEEERFHYHPLPITSSRIYSNGISGLRGWLRLVKPDFVYLIGGDVEDYSLQVAYVKRRYLPNMKVAMFTMRGLDMPRYIRYRLRWAYLRGAYDAIFTHCPLCEKVLREQGHYMGPIYLQTQVGVNREWFHPDAESRKAIRDQYGIADDEYVFGCVARINLQKGLLDILEALPKNTKVKFMVVGDGPDLQILKNHVHELALENRVIFTGFVDLPHTVSKYFTAFDGFVLMSRTSEKYIDTYPLALSQAMATQLPCIASTSGGLAYSVGNDGIVVPEGDVEILREKMEWLSDHRKEGKEMGIALEKRLLHTFEMRHLNHCFYTTLLDILNGRVNPLHHDQTQFTF